MMIPYNFSVRSQGLLAPGLKPTWKLFTKVDDGSDMSKYAPPITELGGGIYNFSWNAEIGGNIFGIVDAGEAVTNPYEREIEMYAYKGDSVIYSGKLIPTTPATP